MQVHIDFPKRVRTLQAELARQGIDVLVGTRLKTITHVSGAFVPWRGAVVIPADGEPNFLEIMALTCNLPGVGGMRFERPVVVTESGAECLSRTPIEPWILGT